MQRVVDTFIRRPVFASMLIATLVVVGIASLFSLRVDRFPSVDLPTVSVRTTLPGAATEEVETLVSQRIEEAVNTIEGIDQLRSISGNGSSFVIITFDLDRDIEAAAQDVRDRVATVLRDLPPEAEAPIIGKFDNDQSPVLTFALSSERPIRELTELADKIVKPQLERSTGVGEVRISGGAERSINLWIDADRLRAYGLSISAVRDALRRQNAEIPGGAVTDEHGERVLRTMGRIEDPAAFGEIVVGRVDGQPIRLRDVGRVEDGTKEIRSVSRLDGVPCVTLQVRRQSGANTMEVIGGVKRKLEQVRAELPPDVRVEVIRDQSRYIGAALREIETHLVLGSLLASMVVLVFMRSWRSTLIAAVAIPCSTVASFAVMDALGFTLNSVTMLALVLMVGIVIDDAIVVLENIFRFIEEKGRSPHDAAREGTAEIALAVVATTLSLAVIFVPVSFMSSISGRFLYQFGITAAAAVMVSLVVSFTLTPTMSARLLRVRAGTDHDVARSRRGLYGLVERGYLWLLRGALQLRPLVALLAVATIASAWPLYDRVAQEYTPSDVDEAEFEVRVSGPQSVSLPAMDDAMRAVERAVASLPAVRTVLAEAGGGFISSVGRGELFVRIAPHGERTLSVSRLLKETLNGTPGRAFEGNYTQRDVMVQVRETLKQFRELRCSVRNIPSFNIGGGNFEIDFSILGPELEALADYGAELLRRANEIPGVADADITLRLDQPELRVVVDRERATDLGVDVQDIASALRLMVGGEERASRFRDRQMGEEYDVQIRLEEADRADQGRIAELSLQGRRGLVRLDEIVHLAPATSAARVDRLDRQRQVSLRASIGPGYALGDRLAALRAAVDDMDLPPVYTTRVSGRGRELERTFEEFLWAFLLSVVLMYIILASQFESLVHPLTILLSLPLSIPFALWSLEVSGNTLNLYSALGILVLFGVVKKNSILQIDHTNQLRARGLARYDAILTANRDRLRPILMTTLSLVAGMLPLALGTGPGAEERRAVAVVVIGGQTLSLLLTLIVTPIAYSYFDDLGRLFTRRTACAPAAAAELADPAAP